MAPHHRRNQKRDSPRLREATFSGRRVDLVEEFMSTNHLLPLLSLLIVTTAVACGTAEDNLTDAGADATGDADVGPSDTGGCEGRNPSESCMDFGCGDGQTCALVADGCAPSACICSDGSWQCTADCGPQYACVPSSAECPTVPPIGESCSVDGLRCDYGTECCCGECFASTFCGCQSGDWACGATDACFIESCAGRTCDSDVDCEGGGFETSCVEGVCARVAGEDGWSVGPNIEFGSDCVGAGSDSYELGEVAIDGDALLITVSYSGGCAEHPFRVCWDGSFAESDPVQARFELQHESNDDPCEAYPTEVLRLPLASLRTTYNDAYASKAGSVSIRLDETTTLFTFDACTGVDLSECPAECPDDAFSRCGEACDGTDEDCGNEIGGSMSCLEGAFACTVHPPLGAGCNQVCRR